MAQHVTAPFPASVEKGLGYGLVDAVMIGADIYGWALQVAKGSTLSADDRRLLTTARDDLAASLAFFPADARPA